MTLNMSWNIRFAFASTEIYITIKLVRPPIIATKNVLIGVSLALHSESELSY